MQAILDKWDYVSKKFQGARQRTIFKNIYDGVEKESGSTVLSKLPYRPLFRRPLFGVIFATGVNKGRR